MMTTAKLRLSEVWLQYFEAPQGDFYKEVELSLNNSHFNTLDDLHHRVRYLLEMNWLPGLDRYKKTIVLVKAYDQQQNCTYQLILPILL